MIDSNNIEIYSSRDRIRNQLIELAKKYLELENFDFNKTSYLSYLIDSISTLDADLMYYASSIYREMFLTKALQKESILNWSSMLGYRPNLALPAYATLLIDIPIEQFNNQGDYNIVLRGRNDSTSDINNSKVFKVYSVDNIPYSLTSTVYINIKDLNGENNKDISIKQELFSPTTNSLMGHKNIEYRLINGKLQFFLNFIQLIDNEETFTVPQLLPNEFHNVEYKYKKQGSISNLNVFMLRSTSNTARGRSILERWNMTQTLFGISSDYPGYSYRETIDGIVVSFGNGIVGKQPQPGSEILINVALSRGEGGNVISGSIRKADKVSTVLSSGQIKNVHLSVINKEPAFGGIDAPTMDDIRTNTLNHVSMNRRLVSESDFNNATTILRNMPISNIFQVLKRSDLKRNEITLFTELIYNNFIVPSRNHYLDKLNIYSIDDNNVYVDNNIKHIPKDYVVEIDGEKYSTMFDLFLDRNTLESTYYYYLDELDKQVDIINTISNQSEEEENPTSISFFPSYTNIKVNRAANPELEFVDLNLFVRITSTTNLENMDSDYFCEVSFNKKFGNQRFVLSRDMIDNSMDDFKHNILEFKTTEIPDLSDSSKNNNVIYLEDIPDSIPVEFIFKIYKGDHEDPNYHLNSILLSTSKAEITIKKSLNDFMYSQINETEIEVSDTYTLDTTNNFIAINDKNLISILNNNYDIVHSFEINNNDNTYIETVKKVRLFNDLNSGSVYLYVISNIEYNDPAINNIDLKVNRYIVTNTNITFDKTMVQSSVGSVNDVLIQNVDNIIISLNSDGGTNNTWGIVKFNFNSETITTPVNFYFNVQSMTRINNSTFYLSQRVSGNNDRIYIIRFSDLGNITINGSNYYISIDNTGNINKIQLFNNSLYIASENGLVRWHTITNETNWLNNNKNIIKCVVNNINVYYIAIENNNYNLYNLDMGTSSTNYEDYTTLEANLINPKDIKLFNNKLYIAESETTFNIKIFNLINRNNPELELNSVILNYGYDIYDIPVIKQDYLRTLTNKPNFVQNVLYKLINFNIFEYKMLTDYVNLKLPNCTGYTTNMKYNKSTKQNIHYINPSNEIIDSIDVPHTRVAITKNDNYFNGSPYNMSEGGFIAEWTIQGWVFDILKYNDLVDLTTDGENIKYIYNGNHLLIPKQKIPVEIDLIVYKNYNITINNDVLINNIKNAMINYLSHNFGYNKSLYISRITRIIQSVNGVRNCKVLKPTHDIFFDANITDNMTPKELLRYTPELIFFDINNIKIEVKE